MERAHLIWLKRTNNSVQHAPIMEQNEIPFLPIVRVHQLNEMKNVAARRGADHQKKVGIRRGGMKERTTHVWRDGRSLHLVKQITNLLDVLDVCSIGVKCAFTRCTLREWIDE